MIRTLIRRWLGIREDHQIRNMIWGEIDADAVWRNQPGIDRRNARAERFDLRYEREAAIRLGHRENPGA